MRKIKRNFLRLLHTLGLSVPILMVLGMCVLDYFNGYTAETINGVASQTINFTHDLDVNANFEYFMTNYSFTFGLINIDFLTALSIPNTMAYMQFINWYINYVINVELLLFLPFVILTFIHWCKNLCTFYVERMKED